MKIIADLHIHGKYSQATSKSIDIPNLEKYARIKGISLLGTGDFTHPKWIEEIRKELTEDETGILKTKSGFNFVLQTEISLAYTQGGKGRRVHNLVLAPNLEVVKQITDYFLTKGRVDYDGRPIFKIPCPEFVESLQSISKEIEVIPAHIWTPWFAMFGSKSGFDSIKDCFLDKADRIHAIETGLSSDPAMNWRLSQLDNIQILSFSDLHSFWPWRIGREATIFDIKPTYKALLDAIKTGENIDGTIEVDPGYGKYHFDGHRACNIMLSPQESMKNNKMCPVCKRELTIGVLNRVEELADRGEGYKSKNAKPFYTLVPLSELIAAKLNSAVASRQVWAEYNKITKETSEFEVMLNMDNDELLKRTDGQMAELILQNREGKIFVKPGYDGMYGELVLDQTKPEPKVEQEWQQTKKRKVQTGLSQFL
ncbi:MAG: endonuclease Q family protein [Candidatus Woesearchaeota archaeon]